jgi:hypothetical protein
MLHRQKKKLVGPCGYTDKRLCNLKIKSWTNIVINY